MLSTASTILRRLYLATLWTVLLAVHGTAYGEGYALLIGINDYAEINDLSGCINDTLSLREALVREYGFADANVEVLLDSRATLEGIRRAMGKMTQRMTSRDTFVFSFSGHGTQIPDRDGDEAAEDSGDRRDEAICPYDTSNKDDSVLCDDELGRLLDALPSSEVVVILGCCHAGTGTKELNRIGKPRRVMLRPLTDASPLSPKTRTDPPMGKDLYRTPTRQRRFIFSACTACQTAPEVPIYRYLEKGEWRFIYVGLLHYYLIEGLRGAADTDGDGKVSYGEAHGYASRRCDEHFNGGKSDIYNRSDPVMEAQPIALAYAPVFGVEKKRPMFAKVTAIKDGVSLDLGVAHGLKPGQQLALHRSIDDIPHGPRVGVTEVQFAGLNAETAKARLIDGGPLAGDLVGAPIVNPLAPADVFVLIESLAIGGQSKTSSRLLLEINRALAALPQVRIDALQTYDLRISVSVENQTEPEEFCFDFYDTNGQLLDSRTCAAGTRKEEDRTIDDIRDRAKELILALRARRSIAALANPQPGFGLQAVVDRLPSEGDTLAQYRHGDGLKIGLKSTADCWFYIIAVDPDGSPRLWCPLPNHEHRAAGGRKLLFPGPGQTITLDGPTGVYQVKLLAVRRPLSARDLAQGTPRPETFRHLAPEEWAEQSVSLRLVE